MDDNGGDSRPNRRPTLSGLLAARAAEKPFAFEPMTFPDFIAAQVLTHLPEEERGPALAWLARFSEQFQHAVTSEP